MTLINDMGKAIREMTTKQKVWTGALCAAGTVAQTVLTIHPLLRAFTN